MKDSIHDVRFPPPGRTAAEDTEAVMKFYKLPRSFPPAVLAEARRVGDEDLAQLIKSEHRLDLRRKFIFTCDPVTARDFDDALSLETDRKGNRVLGVHIADVSHYVRPGTALDREAYRRSTSVYLCDRVVPMLPEELCNGVCSLVPNEDRLAFSVFMTFDKNGEMVKRSFARSVIRSKARYTYEQVMEIIGGKGKTRENKTIRAISELAQTLRAARFAAGALDLEMPEPEVLLDANGEMESIVTRPYDESHQMIEECMVAANEAVAKELWTRGVKILARLHETPDPEKILMLRSELRGLGVKMGNIENPKVFAQFLRSIKKHPLYGTISMLVLRSMKKAVYDSTTIGHFGLAKRFYAHFTSPIRRYPDLTLHRQLAAYLGEGTPSEGSGNPSRAKVPPKLLAKWAEHTSECEQIATEAERALLEIKKFRFLEEQIASRDIIDYEAVVSKVMPFGCFVDIPEIAASGLVHVSVLSNRYLSFNESDQSLSAGGESWHAGDRLRVHVARVDFRTRRIDFVPVRGGSKRKRSVPGKVYFVSGIDTGIGKTVVTGLMARDLLARGVDVITVKLVQTGNVGSSEDVAEHRRICGGRLPRESDESLTAPQIFEFPSSPLLAASLEGRKVDLDKIAFAVKTCAARHDVVLVEGAGGLDVPLTEDDLTIDFAARQGWPLILVTCGRLGSINHALLSLEAAHARGMRVAGVVHNWCREADSKIDRDAVETVRRYLVRMGYPPNVVRAPQWPERAPWPSLDFRSLFG